MSYHDNRFRARVVFEVTVELRSNLERTYRLLLASQSCTQSEPCKERVHRRLWIERRTADRLGNPAWIDIDESSADIGAHAWEIVASVLMQYYSPMIRIEAPDWYTLKRINLTGAATSLFEAETVEQFRANNLIQQIREIVYSEESDSARIMKLLKTISQK